MPRPLKRASVAWSSAWAPAGMHAPAPPNAGAWLAGPRHRPGPPRRRRERRQAGRGGQDAARAASQRVAARPLGTDAATDEPDADLPLSALTELADARLDALRGDAEQAGRAAEAVARTVAEREDAEVALRARRDRAGTVAGRVECVACRLRLGRAGWSLTARSARCARLEQATRDQERLDLAHRRHRRDRRPPPTPSKPRSPSWSPPLRQPTWPSSRRPSRGRGPASPRHRGTRCGGRTRRRRPPAR